MPIRAKLVPRLRLQTKRAARALVDAADSAHASARRSFARAAMARYFDPRCVERTVLPPASLVYLPWMPTHGDALLQRASDRALPLVALPLFVRPEVARQRGRINRFVCDHPDLFYELVREVLAQLSRAKVAAVVFTHDWPAPMRQVVFGCRELGIPTVLIPHEAVFAERSRYYVDRITGADVPLCDAILAWGELQRSVFVERGYPLARTRIVGSPKLDDARNYRAQLSNSEFRARYRLPDGRPIVLFALQPLDAQRDQLAARDAQARAPEDMREACREHGYALLVRFPPGGHAVLRAAQLRELQRDPHVALDRPPDYCTSALESLSHCSLVCAINSTMLLEGALMGRHALVLRYLDFVPLFAASGMPEVCDHVSLSAALDTLSSKPPGLDEKGTEWAARTFSAGIFDGRSIARMRSELIELSSDGRGLGPLDPTAHLFGDRLAGTSSATAALHRAPTSSMAYLEALLGYRHYLRAPRMAQAQTADIFVRWGLPPTPAKLRQDKIVGALGRPQLWVEDGFLRSRELGLSGSPGLSVLVDTQTAYYDASRPSRLETRLNSGHALDAAQLERATRCIAEIRTQRVSKYNHAPDSRARYGAGACVLLVDQRFGDASVPGALADASAFDSMLTWALNGSRQVLVKRHPDAISGGKRSYFSGETPLLRDARVTLIDADVNPHTLFDQVDEVCVVASGMGLEAALAGLPVRCFGAPFYAGWGFTHDMVAVPRRSRARSVTEMFHYAYLEASRYYSAHAGHPVEIEEVIAELSSPTRAGPR